MNNVRKAVISAVAVGAPTPTLAQGIYLEGPGVGFGIGPSYRHREYRSYDYDRPQVYVRPYRERHYYERRHWDWD